MERFQPWGAATAPPPASHSQSQPPPPAPELPLLVAGSLGLLGQAADRQVVHHLFDLLHVVLEAVVALPQRVVLQVEQAEARVQLVDEVGDAERSGVVSCCDAVHRQSGLEVEKKYRLNGYSGF